MKHASGQPKNSKFSKDIENVNICKRSGSLIFTLYLHDREPLRICKPPPFSAWGVFVGSSHIVIFFWGDMVANDCFGYDEGSQFSVSCV